MKHASIAVLASIALLTTAHAQTPAPDSTPTITARSTLVLVPALVREKSGQLVYALKADDFSLTDDGKPQKLHLEEDTGSEPLALVVLIETGGAGARAFNTVAASLPPMLESVVGNVSHKIGIVAFDSHPELLQPFTVSLDRATDTLHSIAPDCAGQDCAAIPDDNGAAIFDSIAFAVDLLRTQPIEYRRAILLISETLDRGSQTSLDDALRAINDTNTTIYSIGFSTGKSEAKHYGSRELPTTAGGLGLSNPNPNPPHGCMGKDPNPDPDASKNKAAQAYDCATQLIPPLALAKMAFIAATDGLKRNVPETVARLTGGEYYKFSTPKQLERDLATISNHVPNRYILSFQPQSPHPGLHAIQLELKSYPNLHVTARTSYWADSPSPASPASPSAPQ